MEPLAAVGLAGNIIQFIDTASKILSGTAEIYRSVSGATSEHLEAENIARLIKSQAEKATIPEDAVFWEEDAALRAISQQCASVSNDLLALIQRLKVKPNQTWGESFAKAVKGAWKKEEINSLNQRLDRMSDLLSRTILPSQLSKLDRKLESAMVINEQLETQRSQDIHCIQKELGLMSQEIKEGFLREGAMVRTALSLAVHAERQFQDTAGQRILDALRFDTMDARHAGSPAHFFDWLKGEDKLHWIAGKPGSGKSTLMKHLYTHRRTRNQLQIWADAHRLMLASFFIWSPGKVSLQKSLDGVLRSLIFQILSQEPELIPRAFPVEWNMAISGVFIASLVEMNIKLCVFLDGLDEYHGRPNDIISLVETLKSSRNVKIYVSSRPWNEFENAFGQHDTNKLYMQDLTREDIRLYVRQTFEEDPMFRDLVNLEGEERSLELVRDIVDAAKGVFLWVFLVVRSLLEGLNNADTFTDLLKRLHSLPSDLNDYFERILFTVEEIYSSRMGVMFLAALAAAETLPLICYWFIDREEADNAMRLKPEPVTRPQAVSWSRAMRKRLNACSKGLLEVHAEYIPADNTFARVYMCQKVDFLHRSVRDFLETPQAQRRLHEKVGPDFDPGVTICKGLLAQLKMIPSWFSHDISHLVSLFFAHAHSLEQEKIPLSTEITILEELRSTICRHNLTLSYVAILSRCMKAQVWRFVAQELRSAPALSQTQLGKLLEEAIWEGLLSSPAREVVKLLFENGADLNYHHGEIGTPWACCVRSISNGDDRLSRATQEDVSNIYRMMILLVEHGAALKMRLAEWGAAPGPSALQVLQRVLSSEQIRSLIHLARSRATNSAKESAATKNTATSPGPTGQRPSSAPNRQWFEERFRRMRAFHRDAGRKNATQQPLRTPEAASSEGLSSR